MGATGRGLCGPRVQCPVVRGPCLDTEPAIILLSRVLEKTVFVWGLGCTRRHVSTWSVPVSDVYTFFNFNFQAEAITCFRDETFKIPGELSSRCLFVYFSSWKLHGLV